MEAREHGDALAAREDDRAVVPLRCARRTEKDEPETVRGTSAQSKLLSTLLRPTGARAR
jgi:hypothetical protein